MKLEEESAITVVCPMIMVAGFGRPAGGRLLEPGVPTGGLGDVVCCGMLGSGRSTRGGEPAAVVECGSGGGGELFTTGGELTTGEVGCFGVFGSRPMTGGLMVYVVDCSGIGGSGLFTTGGSEVGGLGFTGSGTIATTDVAETGGRMTGGDGSAACVFSVGGGFTIDEGSIRGGGMTGDGETRDSVSEAVTGTGVGPTTAVGVALGNGGSITGGEVLVIGESPLLGVRTDGGS